MPIDWAGVGTFGCERCAALRRAYAKAIANWARNPLGAPRPGTTEFNSYVEKEADSDQQGGSSPARGPNPPRGQG